MDRSTSTAATAFVDARCRRLGAMLLALFVVLGWPRSARSEVGELALEWSAPAGCPGGNEVLAQVHQLAGTPDGKLQKPLWAKGSVTESGGRFQLELSWRTEGAGAVRSVEGETCAALAQAAAVILALAADPAAEQPGAKPVNSEVPANPTEPRPPPSNRERSTRRTETVPPREPRDSDHDRTGELAARARIATALELGTLPRPSPGLLVGGELAYAPFALVLDGLTFVPVEREVLEGAGRFWLSALSLRPCGLFSKGRFGVEPCVAVEAHVIESRGRKLAVPDDRWAWFLRVGASVEGAYPLSPALSLVAGGALLAAPSRPTFVIGREVRVHEPAPLAGRLTLGFSLRP